MTSIDRLKLRATINAMTTDTFSLRNLELAFQSSFMASSISLGAGRVDFVRGRFYDDATT